MTEGGRFADGLAVRGSEGSLESPAGHPVGKEEPDEDDVELNEDDIFDETDTEEEEEAPPAREGLSEWKPDNLPPPKGLELQLKAAAAARALPVHGRDSEDITDTGEETPLPAELGGASALQPQSESIPIPHPRGAPPLESEGLAPPPLDFESGDPQSQPFGTQAVHEGYKMRELCELFIQELISSRPGSLTVKAVSELLDLVANATRSGAPNEQARFEKDVVAAQGHMMSWVIEGISSQELMRLRDCIVDPMAGHTLPQKLVAWGLSGALEEKFGPQWFTRESILAVDKAGNNLLHLAAMSESTKTVEVVLKRAMQILQEPADLRALLSAKTVHGMRPKDVAAKSLTSPAIHTQLKRAWSVLVPKRRGPH